MPAARRGAIRRRLLRWYDANRRDLPWRRRAQDAYAQWVAEIMLQQTRVPTVVAYYDRFLRRFPDVSTLARARHEEVLKRWEGLGYYRRALHLHRAAQVVSKDGGTMPRNPAELRRLPGVGVYTAAAIASIAYNEPVAAVDGNVSRVLARLCGIADDVKTPRGRSRIEYIANQLLSRTRPGDFNQAWMDLGSRLCTPRAPNCPACPLNAHCDAARTGRSLQLPHRGTVRGQVPERLIVVGVFVHDGRMLVRRRATGGLWSGLWEFPNIEHGTTRTMRRALTELAKQERLKLTDSPVRADVVRHRLTHRAMTFHVWLARVSRPGGVHVAQSARGRRPSSTGRTAEEPTRWVARRAFARLSVSTAYRRVFAAAQAAWNAKLDQ